MNAPTLDAPAPDFALPATGGETVSLADLRARKVVLYFYPRDATPGCTTESRDFRDAADDFAAAGAIVYGVSRDSLASHEKFKAAESMPHELLADEDGAVCTAYDVLKTKTVYGRESVGIERSTFLIDAHGVLRREWRGVKVPGHVEAVLEAVRAL